MPGATAGRGERDQPSGGLMTPHARIATALLAGMVLAVGSLARAQAAGEGAKFYAEYRTAFAKAKAIEDVLPYLSKGRIEMVNKTPKEDRPKMFELMKMMDMKDVRVVKETKIGAGFVLEATGKGAMGPGEAKGTINIVRESGKLKLDKESWKQ
jgi:hypothetical protein